MRSVIAAVAVLWCVGCSTRWAGDYQASLSVGREESLVGTGSMCSAESLGDQALRRPVRVSESGNDLTIALDARCELRLSVVSDTEASVVPGSCLDASAFDSGNRGRYSWGSSVATLSSTEIDFTLVADVVSTEPRCYRALTFDVVLTRGN
jgi:hypothetical protein